MEENFDFDKVGKKMPYKVPPAFFEKMTESTLAEAERRSTVKKQTWFTLWPAMAVAASLALLLTIGYFVYTGQTTSDDMMAVQEQEVKQEAPAAEEIQVIPNEENTEQPGMAQVEQPAKPGPVVALEQPKPDVLPRATKAETLDDVLANISDEELMLLAAVAETDLIVYEQTFE
ncbi:MAG: hypothetical protein LPK09_10235 [Hymenobacteraceae bacterium]|nr:hypothetical protein [Hymenobacteraceae bacterium]